MAKSENNFIKIDKKDGARGYPLFLTFIGALVYFVNVAQGFGEVLLAIVKAAVWPAILVYNVLQALSA